MHPARSTISKTPPPTPNLLREDILLEAFEQAGKKVTEHVLDSILGATGAARILLSLGHSPDQQFSIARKRGRENLPGDEVNPPPGPLDETTTAPAVHQRWPLSIRLDLRGQENASLFFGGSPLPPRAWLSECGGRIRSMLSISLLLDELHKSRRARRRRNEETAGESPNPVSGDELQRLFPEIIGKSMGIENVLSSILQVAGSDIPVLIRGESGTGKELVAAALHRLSPRKEMPLVCENCGAIAEQLAEAELFGHEKGAFTGASIARMGLIERAQGGTLFLDEVSEMEPSLQKKLLRVLQEKSVRRVGAIRTVPVDFRLVSATNRDLEKMVARKRFREDLYYRLNVTSIRLPALRHRREDIPLLVDHFVGIHSRKNRQEGPSFSSEILEVLSAYDWPGNIRELGNEIWKLVATVEGAVKPWHLSGKITSRRGSLCPTRPGSLEEMEKEVLGGAIADALKKAHGNRAQAARLLGIGRATLYRRLERYGIRCD